MKSMKLTGIRRMAIHDAPSPTITSDNDVLIEMGCVGVCGSDVHYFVSGRIGSQVVQYPFAVGHEGAGVVKAVGVGVSRVKAGDRIAVEPAMSCWRCDQCTSGRPHTCRSLRFLGCPGQAEGCLSEQIVMPQECCYPIPDDMTLEEAALSEPLSIGVYAVRLANLAADSRIGILGAGPIGMSVLLSIRLRGNETVYVTDKIDERLAAASRMGASWTGNRDARDVVGDITAAEPMLLDAVFECCGEQDAVDDALRLLKPGGKLVFIGIPSVDSLSFNMDLMRRKEICVQNVRRQNECVQPALDLIDSGRCNVQAMVTHRFPFARTAEAFELVDGYRDGVVKAMIEFE